MEKAIKTLIVIGSIIFLIFIGVRLFYYIPNRNSNVQFWIGNHSPVDSILVEIHIDNIKIFSEKISNQEFYKIYKHKASFGIHNFMLKVNSDTILNTRRIVFPNKWIAFEYYGKSYDNQFSITIKSTPIRIE